MWLSIVTHTRNLCSAFDPSKCTHTAVNTHTHTENTHPEQWPAILLRRSRNSLGFGVWCLAQWSHLSCCIEFGRERWLFTTKSIWLDNWDCLGFWEIKNQVWISIIVGWLCPQTAKTHSNDIFHPMSPLNLKYYNLNSSDERFRKPDSNQCWVLL